MGVKLDEDNLKILDELPNSAVEMQVKDKVCLRFLWYLLKHQYIFISFYRNNNIIMWLPGNEMDILSANTLKWN